MAVPSTMLPLGTPAPDFALPDPAGRLVSFGESDGAPATVVAFLCNHCPYVQHVAPVLAEVTGDLIDRGVAVYGISSNDVEAYPDDAPQHMATESARHGYRFPYLYDESQDVARAYQAACTPDFYVFDGQRRLAYRGQFDGSRPSSDEPVTGRDLLAAVDAVLAGSAVDGDQRPSMGCSIKWRPGNTPPWG
jgi:peroxiredoxin